MTALPSTLPDIDELVKQNRAKTPRPATEIRKVPRSSVSELNALDLDEIRDRYVRHGFDDRSPITKVLDLIDLPRNVMGNLIFRGTGVVDSKGLRSSALGLPEVKTSDALKSLGVENRIVRGIAGFVGDVALDPLTYLGPAGWGLEVMDNAGRAVRIGKAGAKGLKSGIKEVSRGGVPSHQPTRELFDALLANAPDEVKAGDAARKAAYLSERAMGKIGAETKAGKAAAFVTRGLGGDKRARGGAIASELADETPVGDAVRAFVSRAGSAAGPGYGKGGSQIAHIPFTERSIKVPGFTRAGRAAEEDLALARSGAPRSLEEITTPRMAAAARAAAEISEQEKSIRAHTANTTSIRKTLEKQIEAAKKATPNGVVSGEVARLETMLLDHERRATERLMELRGQSDVSAQNLKSFIEQQTADPLNVQNPRELFALKKVQDEISTAYDLAKKRQAADVDADIAGRIQLDADQHADDTMEVWDRIREQQMASKKGGPKSRQVRTDPPTALDDMFTETPYSEPDLPPIGLPQRNAEIRQIRRQMKAIKKNPAGRELLKKKIEDLMKRPTLHDVAAGKIAGDGQDIAPPQYLPASATGDILIPADPVVRQRIAEQARPILDQIDAAESELARIGSTSKTPERDSLFAGDAMGQPAVDAATLEREAEYQRQVTRLLGLHDQLEAVTSGARGVPMQSIDDAREAARLAHFNSLDTMERSLADLADQDIDMASEVADAVHRTMEAYQRHHNAVRGAVEEARKLDSTEDMMVRLMNRFLGTDDRVVGRAALGGYEASSRVPGADRVQQVLSTTFGEKGTSLADRARQLRHAFSPGWRREVQKFMGTVSNELRGAFQAVGVKPTGDDMDQAAQLLYAYTIRDQAARGQLEAGREILYTTMPDGKTPSAMMKIIQDAATSGKFDPAIYGDLTKRLEAIAAEYGSNLLEQLKNVEVEQGALKSARPGYFPNVATPGAREAMARGARYTKPAGQKVQKAAREAFQKERSTDQVRFVSQRPGMEGEPRRLFGFEVDQAERLLDDPSEIAGLRAEGYKEAADKLEELVADYREYLALPERPRFRATDPYELNDMMKEGRFSLLLDGIDPVGGFMQTNMVSALGDRVGQHTRAIAREQWSQYLKQFAITVPEFRGYSDKNGKVLRSTSGAEAQVSKGIDSFGREVPVAIVGGQKYRPITVKYKYQNDNPLIEMLGKENVEPLYHEQVASAIERAADIFEGENANIFLKGVDELTRQWKSITLLHPSWSVMNMVGDVVNAFVGGANLRNLFNPESAKFSAKAIRFMENPEKMKDLTINIRGQQVSAQQLIDDALANGVLDGTMMQETAFRLIEKQLMTLSSQARGAGVRDRFRPSTIMSDWKEMAQRYAIGRNRTSANRADKTRAAGFVASDRYMNNVIGPWFRINSKASNFMRMQVFLSYLEDGYDVQSAARKTVRSQMDYSDTTRIERDVFKRLLPFYSWIRNNGAYQMRALMERPIYAASFPKLKENLETAINGDEKVPAQMRPNWMRNAMALQVGSDPENRQAVLFGNGIPIADTYQLLTPVLGTEGLMDFAHYLGSGLNPVFNVPFQLATGHETFSGRTIGADQYSGDLSAGEFLRNQIRPLAEVGKTAKAFDRSVGEGVGRLVLGGRVQDFGQERLESSKLREYRDKERRIRAAISRAERDGNKERSLQGRVQLMQLYAAMQDAGLEVPRWAQRQLETLNTTQ